MILSTRERLIKLIASSDDADDSELFETEVRRLKKDREFIVGEIAAIDQQLKALMETTFDKEEPEKISRRLLQYKNEFPASVKADVLKALPGKISFLNDDVDIVVTSYATTG